MMRNFDQLPSTSCGVYRYCGDPKKIAVRLLIEENLIQGNDLYINPSRTDITGDKRSFQFSSLSATTTSNQGVDKKSTDNTLSDYSSGSNQYIIKWETTYPTVKKLLSNLENNDSNAQLGWCNMTKNYKLVTKMMNNKYHLSPCQQSDNYTLHNQIRWSDTSIVAPTDSLGSHDVRPRLYNHYHNSTSTSFCGKPVSKCDDKMMDNRRHTLSSKIETICIILEKVLNSSAASINMSESPSSSSQPKSRTNPVTQFPGSIQSSKIDESVTGILDSHQHMLALITFDLEKKLIIIKPDIGVRLIFNRSSKSREPKFTYSLRLTIMDDNDETIDSSKDLIGSIEANINLTRSLFGLQLDQNHKPRSISKKVFSSPINESLLTCIRLDIQYVDGILPRKINNLYARYRLFSKSLIDIQCPDNGINAQKPFHAKIDANSDYDFRELYLEGTSVTSLPNSQGRYNLSCSEQLLIESKKVSQDQPLNLLMEFYSNNFYRKRLEGWALVILPRSNCKKVVKVDIIHYNLSCLGDRLKYHLLGTLPDGMDDIEKVVLSKNRYLLPTIAIGKVVFKFEAIQQVSDPYLDKATSDLLRINDIGTRMIKIDIQSVIQAYQKARKKLEDLEC